MWPFRRKRGRHELGAAVTEIPSVTRAPAPMLPNHPAAAPEALERPGTRAVPARPVPDAPAAEPSAPEGPRVELGFRDGSTAALAPDSAQAKALTSIASLLTQRDDAGS